MSIEQCLYVSSLVVNLLSKKGLNMKMETVIERFSREIDESRKNRGEEETEGVKQLVENIVKAHSENREYITQSVARELNDKDIGKTVIFLILKKESARATEMMVQDIMKNNHIYTTRDDEKSEMWIYYEGIYVPQGRTFIKEYCRKILDQAYTTHLCNQVIAKIEADTYIDQKDFFNNDHPDEIAVENGILNVLSRSLRPFDPNTIFFNKIPNKYTPQAHCEAIISHLKAVLKYEEDLPVIQELFGYLLYKRYNIEKAFMFLGNGRNGKGKTLDIMKRFIGPENCSNISLEQIENESFAMGELFNKMANLAGDISKTSLKNTGRFKGLTGRDLMSAPRKFLPMVHFVNYAKMIFCANDLPMTYDTSPAFWNRWLLIEFPYTFISQKEYDSLKLTEPNGYKIADPDIVEKVTSPMEMQGLLCWSLEGLDRLLKQGDFSYSKNTAEVQDLWMRKSDSFNAFAMDFLVYDYENTIKKSDLRQFYAEFCMKNGLKPCSDKVILHVLTTNFGAYDTRIGDERCWKGIRYNIKPPNPTNPPISYSIENNLFCYSMKKGGLPDIPVVSQIYNIQAEEMVGG